MTELYWFLRGAIAFGSFLAILLACIRVPAIAFVVFFCVLSYLIGNGIRNCK